MALYHNDQLVGPRAVRREAGHRVLGVIELVAVADEGQALGGLVCWLWGARKRRSEGKQSGDHDEPHQEDSGWRLQQVEAQPLNLHPATAHAKSRDESSKRRPSGPPLRDFGC